MADCMQFLSENRLNRCQSFGRFGFLKTEYEPNFGFPHIPTNDFFTPLTNSAQPRSAICIWVIVKAGQSALITQLFNPKQTVWHWLQENEMLRLSDRWTRSNESKPYTLYWAVSTGSTVRQRKKGRQYLIICVVVKQQPEVRLEQRTLYNLSRNVLIPNLFVMPQTNSRHQCKTQVLKK